jgi:hypothetical protein
LPLIEFQQSLHLDGSNTGDGGFARLEYLFKKVGGRLRVLLVSSSLKHIVRVWQKTLSNADRHPLSASTLSAS